MERSQQGVTAIQVVVTTVRAVKQGMAKAALPPAGLRGAATIYNTHQRHAK